MRVARASGRCGAIANASAVAWSSELPACVAWDLGLLACVPKATCGLGCTCCVSGYHGPVRNTLDRYGPPWRFGSQSARPLTFINLPFASSAVISRHMSQSFNHDAQSCAVKRTQEWSWRPRQPRSISATQLCASWLAFRWSLIISDHRGNAQKTKQCLFCAHSNSHIGARGP